jgi:hypothetical protein
VTNVRKRYRYPLSFRAQFAWILEADVRVEILMEHRSMSFTELPVISKSTRWAVKIEVTAVVEFKHTDP